MAVNDAMSRIFGRKVSDDELGLSRIPFPEFDKEAMARAMAETDARTAEYKTKYGDDWLKHYASDIAAENDERHRISNARLMNGAIYDGTWLRVSSDYRATMELRAKQDARMHELYGDRYDELREHGPDDPRVAELLLEEALRTGDWKVLPEELHEEYHKRAKGMPSGFA